MVKIIPNGIWFDHISCGDKKDKFKAENTGRAGPLARLSNVEISFFSSKYLVISFSVRYIKILNPGYILFLIFFMVSCKQNPSPSNKALENFISEEANYRPHYHFTPDSQWMNDPNGMFYLNGKYHLFFQYYPDSNVWGPMHWGHAISQDLISWDELPIALYPDSLGYIFSGSAVVDYQNTSGFGKEGITPIIAMYTYHNMDAEKNGRLDYQSQGIAYSLDEGMTWIKYENNPVLKTPGLKDFRDPKVSWDSISQRWTMVLAGGNKILFYSSKNLKEWQFESEFGENQGGHGGVWECPDLISMKVTGSKDTKMVLLVSINPGGPNGGSATQYFVGDFDGKNFILDENFQQQLNKENALWIDGGRDNYAGVTWSNIPPADGRKIFIGWMSNWDYAREVPTYRWRSSMTLPRELKLTFKNNKYCLQNMPVQEIYQYTKKEIVKKSLYKRELDELIQQEKPDLTKSMLQFEINNLKNTSYRFVLGNEKGESLAFGLNNKHNKFFIDRSKTGNIDFSTKFAPAASEMKCGGELENLRVFVVLDKTSIEVFYNDGEYVMTEIFFPNQPFTQFSVESEDDDILINDLRIHVLK